MHNEPIILLFIKAPLPGTIKSRLASAIGADATLELYERFVLDTIDTVRALGISWRICFCPPGAGTEVRAWLGNDHVYMPQQGNDLGERMEHAFEQIFQEGYERAVLVGSDIPELSKAVLHEAMAALDTSDAVLGPAADGGYYLIGFTAKTFLSSAFHDIIWSTSTVCDETLGRLMQKGNRVHLLQRLHDVDTKEDLDLFFKKHRGDPAAPSRTMSYLIEQEGLLFQP
jgi:rSAM/selenodomain-associated transferase 1